MLALGFVGLGLSTFVAYAGWGHWSFILWTPDVAREEAIEEQYGELLALLREYGERVATDGEEQVRQAVESDPRITEWCERPEVIGVTLRGEEPGSPWYLGVDGYPPEVFGASSFSLSLFRSTYILHSRKWPDWNPYEFVEYSTLVSTESGDFRIELMLDLLQLQGLHGVTYFGTKFGTMDPKP